MAASETMSDALRVLMVSTPGPTPSRPAQMVPVRHVVPARSVARLALTSALGLWSRVVRVRCAAMAGASFAMVLTCPATAVRRHLGIGSITGMLERLVGRGQAPRQGAAVPVSR